MLHAPLERLIFFVSKELWEQFDELLDDMYPERLAILVPRNYMLEIVTLGISYQIVELHWERIIGGLGR